MKNDYSYENFQKRREEIKKNKEGETKTPLELFVYTFATVLLSFLVIATIISPNLNIPALNDDEKAVQDMGSSDFKSRVDYRLQEIKLSDTTPNQQQAVPASQETTAQLQNAMNTANGLVKVDMPTFATPQLPNKNFNNQAITPNFGQPNKKPSQALQQGALQPQQGQVMQQKPKTVQPPAPYVPKTSQANKNYKILVGDYASPEDAQRIADMFSATNSSARPIVKSHNGLYSVQVGAYNDAQKAQNIAGAYRSKNYKVNIVEN